MKTFALLAALVLVAFALPVSVSAGPVLIPYCHTVHGTSCTSLGAKRSCTDVCGNNLSCTCTYYNYPPSTAKYWYCQYEC